MAARLILVEVHPRRAADGVVQIERFAGGGAATPYFIDGQHWMAGITGLPTVITSLAYDGTDIGTGGIPQAAELEWRGANEADMARLAALVWFDADIIVRIGPEGSLPPVVLSGQVLSGLVDNGVLKISLADPAASLKVPLLTATFGGTGGLDGPADWAGTVKRRIWGEVWNVQGEPIDPVTHIYNFADPLRKLQGFVTVRDKGAAASQMNILAWQGSAEATYAALQSLAVPSGGCVACPSIGCVRWWAQPAGDLTADIRGEIGYDGVYAETTAGIAARLVAEVDGPAFADGALAQANADRPAPIGWLAADSFTTVSAMLDTLMGSASLVWVLNSEGKIEIRRWEWGLPVAAFTSHSVNRTAVYRPVGTRKLVYRKNEHKMDRSALAAIVLISDVEFGDGSGLAETLTDLQAAADAAASKAAIAQNAANLANAELANIASDSILSPSEKPTVILDWTNIEGERGGIDGQAAAYGIGWERDSYNAAYSALADYLISLGPYSWWDSTGNTLIDGGQFRAMFNAVYQSRQTLLNAISAKAKNLADGSAQTAAGAAAAAAAAHAVADAAAAAASNAQSAANLANADLAAIASNNVLSVNEKPRVEMDWNIIHSERGGIDGQAAAYGMEGERVSYNAAIDALANYLGALGPYLWFDTNGDTNINGVEFRDMFKAVYDARQTLLNAISAKAKNIADGSAQAAANAATAAANAQAAANLANAGLADIASDSVLSPSEKPTVVLDWTNIEGERGGIDGQAAAYGIGWERDSYNAAYSALANYLISLGPYAWWDSAGNTLIDGGQFRAMFNAVYQSRQTLLNAISAKAKQIADNATADAAQAATTATWTGITGAISGNDVVQTVKPGGGLNNNTVTTPALVNAAVSGYASYTYDGNAGFGYIGGNPEQQVGGINFTPTSTDSTILVLVSFRAFVGSAGGFQWSLKDSAQGYLNSAGECRYNNTGKDTANGFGNAVVAISAFKPVNTNSRFIGLYLQVMTAGSISLSNIAFTVVELKK